MNGCGIASKIRWDKNGQFHARSNTAFGCGIKPGKKKNWRIKYLTNINSVRHFFAPIQWTQIRASWCKLAVKYEILQDSWNCWGLLRISGNLTDPSEANSTRSDLTWGGFLSPFFKIPWRMVSYRSCFWLQLDRSSLTILVGLVGTWLAVQLDSNPSSFYKICLPMIRNEKRFTVLSIVQLNSFKIGHFSPSQPASKE